MRYEISLYDFCKLIESGAISVLTEGKSGTSHGISFRVDSPNGYPGQQVNVHVDRYAWNKDGSRSHAGKWPNRQPSAKIKQIAATQLGIDVSLLEQYDFMLYSEDSGSGEQIMLESLGFSTE